MKHVVGESIILNHKNNNIAGMPMVYLYGTEGDYNFLVMELLGPSLETLLNSCGHKFSLKTTLMIADQMVHFLSLTCVGFKN